MKLEEIIELNGKQYTVTLSRDSLFKIDKYTNIIKTINDIQKNPYGDIDKSTMEIPDDENPFDEEIDDKKIEQDYINKLKNIKKLLARSYWIWLYPKHQLSEKKVEEILEPYFKDDDKIEFLFNNFNKYLEEIMSEQKSFTKNDDSKN